MTPALPPYVTAEYLASLDLVSGQGTGAPGSRCAMQEVRAWLDLDARSDDAPECVSPVIRTYVIGLNDASPATRAALRPLLPSILGTVGSLELEHRRSLRALDWLIREYLPAFLGLVPALSSHAATLRALPPVSDDNAAAAGVVVRAAKDATRDAAWDVVRAVALDVARDVAWAATGAAVWAAARAVAVAAARAAAGDAARAALAPTVAKLQASAIDLLTELCNMKDYK